jgi:hypothetical protein
MPINKKFYQVKLGSHLLIATNLFLILMGQLFSAVEGQPDIPDFLSEEQLEPLKKYETALKANEEKHNGYMSKLNGKYTDALGVAKERMVNIGAVRAINALEAEIIRIKANDTRRSKDIEAAPDYVRKMRSQYDQFVFRVNNLKRSRDGEALYATDRSLAELQLELTKLDQLEKALKLRQYREEFKRPPQPKESPQVNKKDDNKEEINPPEKPEPIDVPFDPSEPEPEPEPEPQTFSPSEYGFSGDIVRPMTSEEMDKYESQLGSPPVKTARGYSAMIASIQRKEVTEITMGKIKGWGLARPQIWKGKPYWTATVTYPTTSLFGTFDTEGMAIISGNRVLEWRYTGSGEEIP